MAAKSLKIVRTKIVFYLEKAGGGRRMLEIRILEF
jgi:hypothetical protein